MAPFQDVIMRVKNTFIDLRVRSDEKRRATFPRRKGTTASGEARHDVQDDADVVAVVSINDDESEAVFDKAVEESTERSTESTNCDSPRARGECTIPMAMQASVDSKSSQPIVYSERTREQWWFGRVWQLSRERQGCRRLQDAIKATTSDEEKLAILYELQGHVQEASRCPNANYVLQTCIAAVKPTHLEFVIAEITNRGAVALAMVSRHKYGCRIVQRLLEHCKTEQVHRLSDLLLDDQFAIQTCSHPFGNYVMQHLYLHSSDMHKSQLVEILVGSVNLAADTQVCTVIGKVLSGGESADSIKLANALDGVPGLLNSMSCTKAGLFTSKLAKQILARQDR